MKKRVLIPASVAVLILIAIVLAIIAARQRAPRNRVFRAAPAEARPKPPSSRLRPPAEWTEQFRALETARQWGELSDLLDRIASDYMPELLPLSVRQLLYPRYFYDSISADAKSYDADPTLVLAIMREESRFNPRAKSEAAARGLLQFIITTARQIGRDVGLVDVAPEDLYDPRVIIRLGAKYISTLSKEFNNDHYAVASSYNAGPKQTALWLRLAPAPGDDYFLSAITFDETKQYVRKVMNSYKRYVELYGDGAPSGGLRAEP